MSAAIPRPGALSRIWSSYLSQLSSRPLRTKMITSGTMFVIGDTIAQFGIEGRKVPFGQADVDGEEDDRWVPSRPVRLGVYGAFIFAPLAHTWLGMVERVKLGSPMKTLAARLALDAAVWGPFIVSMFWSANGLLEGKTIEEVQRKVEMAFLPSWSKSLMVFLPTQIVNFTLVPVQHRLGVLQTVGLGWNIFLSYQNNINNRRLAEASLLLQAATEQAEALHIPLGSLHPITSHMNTITTNSDSVEDTEKLKLTRDIQKAEKQVEEGLKRRQEIRGEEGGGALGVGTRMGWS